MSNFIGVNPSQVDDVATFAVGQLGSDSAGKQYVYCSAGGAITANYAVVISAAFAADQITTTNGVYGLKVGVPAVAVASGQYFWAQVYGNCSVRVLASAAANVRLNTTATAGALDDDGTTGAKEIRGIALSTANGGAAASAAAVLTHPVVGATL